MGKRANVFGLTGALSWALLLVAPACVLDPHDGKVYSSKVPAISVYGYTGAPGDRITFEGRASAGAGTAYEAFWTLTADTFPQRVGDVQLYRFSGNIPILDRHWEPGFSGYKARFRARSSVEVIGLLASVQEDWDECFLADPNPQTFLQNCSSPNSPWTTIYTADYEYLTECADCMCEVCSPVTSTCRSVVDTSFPACSVGGDNGVCFDGQCITTGPGLRPGVGRINCCNADWCDADGQYFNSTCLDPLPDGVPCDPTGVEAPLESLNQAGHCVSAWDPYWGLHSECVYNAGDPRSGVCGDVACSLDYIWDCWARTCDPEMGCQARPIYYSPFCNGDQYRQCFQGECIDD